MTEESWRGRLHRFRSGATAPLGISSGQVRSILMLRDLEEHSIEETATALGLTEATVKSRLHRARVTVRALIESYLNG